MLTLVSRGGGSFLRLAYEAKCRSLTLDHHKRPIRSVIDRRSSGLTAAHPSAGADFWHPTTLTRPKRPGLAHASIGRLLSF